MSAKQDQHSTLRVVVVGCGDMGKQHAEVWSKGEFSKLVGIADPLTERARNFAALVSTAIIKDCKV